MAIVDTLSLDCDSAFLTPEYVYLLTANVLEVARLDLASFHLQQLTSHSLSITPAYHRISQNENVLLLGRDHLFAIVAGETLNIVEYASKVEATPLSKNNFLLNYT